MGLCIPLSGVMALHVHPYYHVVRLLHVHGRSSVANLKCCTRGLEFSNCNFNWRVCPEGMPASDREIEYTGDLQDGRVRERNVHVLP